MSLIVVKGDIYNPLSVTAWR